MTPVFETARMYAGRATRTADRAGLRGDHLRARLTRSGGPVLTPALLRSPARLRKYSGQVERLGAVTSGGGNGAPAAATVAVDTLSDHLKYLHDRLAIIAPDVERVACALYDPEDDVLKTFINSTRSGRVIRGYEYELSRSDSLSHLARITGDPAHHRHPGTPWTLQTAHSRYVRDEGYLSSFTVPMHHRGAFLGMIFFDSRRNDTFTPELQRELTLYAQLITAGVAGEL